MSDLATTALAEYRQGSSRPGTLCEYRVDSISVADLCDELQLRLLDLPTDQLQEPWLAMAGAGGTPSTWLLAERLVRDGFDGALVPSAQVQGAANLVLWRWNEVACDTTARVVDPQGDLPANQLSWP